MTQTKTLQIQITDSSQNFNYKKWNNVVWKLEFPAKMPRGGTAGGGKRGSSLNFHKPAEPSFLKRFKEKVGFKEKVTTIDDKVRKCIIWTLIYQTIENSNFIKDIRLICENWRF